MTLAPEDFVAGLASDNAARLAALADKSAAGTPGEQLTVPALLKLALRNEYEAADLAALWMTDTPELDAKLALARQCGDEAKHYRFIEERLRALGVDLAGFESRRLRAEPAARVPPRAAGDGRARRRRPVHARGHRRGPQRGIRRLLRRTRRSRDGGALPRPDSSRTSGTTTSSDGACCSSTR